METRAAIGGIGVFWIFVTLDIFVRRVRLSEAAIEYRNLLFVRKVIPLDEVTDVLQGADYFIVRGRTSQIKVLGGMRDYDQLLQHLEKTASDNKRDNKKRNSL